MRNSIIDITGEKYGKLTAIKMIGRNKYGYAIWNCKCDCGNEVNVTSNSLRTGRTKSCGCIRKDIWKKQIKDISGQKFGMLTVLQYSHTNNHQTFFLCRCDCGREKIVSKSNLVNGGTRSCGCNRYKEVAKKVSKHGFSHTLLYNHWLAMKQRCYNPRTNSYKNYGGRGIYVCDEWLHDYMDFHNWAMENGYDINAKQKDCSLDRIDINGPYAPWNCRFVNAKEQTKNRAVTKYYTVNGETHTLSEWSDIKGISYGTFQARLRNGWSTYDTIMKPLQKNKSK